MRAPEEQRPQGYESFEMDTRRISIFAVSLLAFLVFVFVGVLALLQAFSAGRGAANREEPLRPLEDRETPSRVWRTDAQDELEALRQEETEILTEFAWIDRKRGIVRIPIVHAMRLTAKRAGDTEREREVSDE